ncbi:MAG: erythromycin esterase family protein, partial [Stackebrandtia sp.]
VMGMSSPLWATEEILDVITWMRSYNEEHRDKVRFFGADLVSLHDLSFGKVTEYVDRVAPGRLPELEAELDPLRMRGSFPEHLQWYAGLTADEQQELIDHGHAMVELLESLPEDSSDIDGEYARQHGRAIVGWYQNYTSDKTLRPVRERFIAASVAWWKRVRGGRIAYWAANAHTGAAANVTYQKPGDTSTGDWAGHYLRKHFGRRYVSIGTAFREGSVTSGWAPPAPHRVDPPRSHLLEATLGRADAADFLLDLRAAGPRPVRDWLTGQAEIRMVHPDYTGDGDASGHTMSTGTLNELFDAIVHIRTTTPSRLLT